MTCMPFGVRYQHIRLCLKTSSTPLRAIILIEYVEKLYTQGSMKPSFYHRHNLTLISPRLLMLYIYYDYHAYHTFYLLVVFIVFWLTYCKTSLFPIIFNNTFVYFYLLFFFMYSFKRYCNSSATTLVVFFFFPYKYLKLLSIK